MYPHSDTHTECEQFSWIEFSYNIIVEPIAHTLWYDVDFEVCKWKKQQVNKEREKDKKAWQRARLRY